MEKKFFSLFPTLAKDTLHYVFSSKFTLYCNYLYLNYERERGGEKERASYGGLGEKLPE